MEGTVFDSPELLLYISSPYNKLFFDLKDFVMLAGTQIKFHTLWWTNIAMENHYFLWEYPL